ncbi:MAG TPA: pitrilysin family protein [Blastocatellia bacterium]|nr:pitrilysin family protein [Blastocatellia bacterium]
MKEFMALAGILIASLALTSSVLASQEYRGATENKQSAGLVLPTVKRDSLLNGLQLVVLEQRGTGTVSVRLRINSGAMFDLTDKGGLADLTAGMLLKGGGGYDAKGVVEAVEQLGLTVNVTVGWDSTDLRVSGPAQALDAIFELLGKLVITPAFDQKELDALKAERVAALRTESANTEGALKRMAVEAVFGAHPFGRPARGTPESLAKITRVDLSFYHKRYYLANNSVLIITGDAMPEDVTRLARSRLGSWKKGEKIAATFRAPEPQTARRVLILDSQDSQVSQATIGQIGVSRRATDFYAALILGDVLNQAGATLVNPEAGAGVQAELDGRFLAGPLFFNIKSSQSGMAPAIESTLAMMSRLQTGPPPIEQVETAKNRLITSFTERLRTTEGAADVILDIELYGLGRDYMINFADRVRAVTPADVHQAAKTYLKPQSVAIVVHGPASQLEAQLKKIGPVTVMR